LATEGEASQALEAIVLAGGAGARFGGAKLTAPWRTGALIDGALAAAFAAPVRSVILVTGADDNVAPAAEALARRLGHFPRLRIVHAVDHAEGMAATLRAGVRALPDNAVGAFVFLGDMPLVPHGILSKLAEALAAGAPAAAPTFEGKRGHPVLFGATLFSALDALSGDEGARSVLARAGVALLETDEPGVLFDIDTKEGLAGAAQEPGGFRSSQTASSWSADR
jgi:molybdenum cofactor cytidylyltransferase